MARAFRTDPAGIIADEPVRGRRRCLPSAADRRAPNVLYVVWDDAGLASWDCYGGLIETPQMNWLAARGLRYSQWHTPALSSPARYSLLTGRNVGAAGMARAGRGGRGRGRPEQGVTIPAAVGTLAEILGGTGYRSYCLGKWHLSPAERYAVGGSRQSWPLGRGFDHYYGFLGAQTSQLSPDLVYDNQYVDAPYSPADGYHLSRDLVDMAIEFIRDGIRAAPQQPWFCYVSFGSNNAPRAAPREWADRYRGGFDMGYDRYREMALGHRKRLGLVPGDAGLAPTGQCARMARGPAAPSWQSLSGEQKRISSRAAESQAGLCSFTDHQIGRVLEYLRESGQLDDTIVVACSANAADADGSPHGPPRPADFAVSWPDDSRPGPGPGYPAAAADGRAYSAAWAWAFGTPYRVSRQSSPGGSTASPLIVSWPREMNDAAGGVRDQYHHAADIVPTILDCAGIDSPRSVNGCRQAPIQGVSMRYTFQAADAPSAGRPGLTSHRPRARSAATAGQPVDAAMRGSRRPARR